MTSDPLSADVPECLHVEAQPCCPESGPTTNTSTLLPALQLARFLFSIVVGGIGASTHSWMAKCELLGWGWGVPLCVGGRVCVCACTKLALLTLVTPVTLRSTGRLPSPVVTEWSNIMSRVIKVQMLLTLI